MKKTKMLARVLLLVLVAVMALTACSSNNTSSSNSSSSSASGSEESNLVANPTNYEEWNPKERYDLSKAMNLTVYFAGDAQVDQAMVDAEFNELMSELINTTCTINFLTWADTTTKYPLVLASGETIDIAFGAAWLDYPCLALKGAYTPIDYYID